MHLEPYVGKTPVRSDSFSIVVDPEDQSRVDALASQARYLTRIDTPVEFARAKELVGKLRAMLNEIQDAERAAKRPFAAVKTAIEATAKLVANLAAQEHKRLLDLCSDYVRELEAEEKRLAKEQAKEENDLDQGLAQELAILGNGSKVPEGGVRHTPQFTLVDPKALIMGGYIRLLRFELDKLACNDCYKRMLMLDPDKEPEIPGLKIELKTSVYIRPRS